MRRFFQETKAFWITLSCFVLPLPLLVMPGCVQHVERKPVVTVLDIKSITQALHERKRENGYVISSDILYTIIQQDGIAIYYCVKTGSKGNHLLNNLTSGHMYRIEFYSNNTGSEDDRFVDVANVEKLD